MKFLKSILPFLFSTSLLCAAIAPNTAELAIGDIVKFGDNSYMVVFNFENYPKYEEFQKNVMIMKNSDAAIAALSIKIESEKDPIAKQNLEKQLKQLKDEFDINDKTMQKGYNFASNRNYMLMFLKTNICVPISDEEFSQFQFKDGTKINPLYIIKRNNERFGRKVMIEGLRENEEFQSILRVSMNARTELAKLRKRLDGNTDANDLAQITKQISELEKSAKENEKKLFEKYGLKGGSSYMIEVEKSKLLMRLTPEDLAKIDAQRKIEAQQKAQKN